MKRRVAIIGAGCSGLTAIKACLEEHLQPVCFEREDDIGGLWNYNDEPKLGKGSVFKSAVINVSKEMMAFSDFPPPRHYATYAPHRQVLEYFKLYAENFGLHEFIRFNTSVEKVEQADDYEETGRWTVIFRKETTNDVKTEIFDGVMVCTGHHTFPHMPIFYGKSQFRGRIMHSHSYRDSTEFADKTVLVVGLGNSGADIAVDLCKHAKQEVSLSNKTL